jgi:mRNA interferase MazF
MHDHLRTAIIAPMTTKGFTAPFRIPVRHSGKNGLILVDQIRAVDKVRLSRRLGRVAPATLSTVLEALVETFAE